MSLFVTINTLTEAQVAKKRSTLNLPCYRWWAKPYTWTFISTDDEEVYRSTEVQAFKNISTEVSYLILAKRTLEDPLLTKRERRDFIRKVFPNG
jgi:hypothetical protein